MKTYHSQSAYICATGAFLPGDPVANEDMESVLGLVAGRPSRYRRRILQSNGIKLRHYAMDKQGKPTHSTEELAALAIQHAVINHGVEQHSIDMIAVGTTLPDLLAPGIASMVHGRIGGKNADVLSCAGICGSGAAAFKAAALSVIAGQHQRVVACGAERPSIIMRGDRFEKESEIERDAHDERFDSAYQYFNADFLRWMLSDGAGAFMIDHQPNPRGLSLKIQFIETASYAHRFPTCMYMGTSNPNQLTAENTWLHTSSVARAEQEGLLLLRQNTRLLISNMGDSVIDFAQQLQRKDYFASEDIAWFLPHISSYFFYEKLQQRFLESGINIPAAKWFTNLETKGNTGAASLFIMLDELFYSGKLKEGEHILVMCPESGRFSVTYALLTAVYR